MAGQVNKIAEQITKFYSDRNIKIEPIGDDWFDLLDKENKYHVVVNTGFEKIKLFYYGSFKDPEEARMYLYLVSAGCADILLVEEDAITKCGEYLSGTIVTDPSLYWENIKGVNLG